MNSPDAILDILPREPLHGERVELSPMTEHDIDARHIGWLNDAEVVRFSNQRFIKHDRTSCLAYLRGFDGSVHRYCAIRRLDTGERIGTITAYLSPQHGTVDLGLMIGERSAWGQGFGLDAWRILLQAALAAPGIRKVTGGTLDCNVGMLKVFERSGMQREAVRSAQELVDGQPHDLVYYARFRDAI